MDVGGACGAWAAGRLDVSGWLPEAAAALGRACSQGPEAWAAPAGWPLALLALVAVVAGVAGVAAAARRGG